MLRSLLPPKVDIEKQLCHGVHLAIELPKLAVGIVLSERAKESLEFLDLIHTRSA